MLQGHKVRKKTEKWHKPINPENIKKTSDFMVISGEIAREHRLEMG